MAQQSKLLNAYLELEGNLGAGKTTLLKTLLAEKPVKAYWAIIVNDFGAIGLDGAQLVFSGTNSLVTETAGSITFARGSSIKTSAVSGGSLVLAGTAGATSLWCATSAFVSRTTCHKCLRCSFSSFSNCSSTSLLSRDNATDMRVRKTAMAITLPNVSLSNKKNTQ
jgi:hypothetical protein